MNVNDALREVENSLRDFISQKLFENYKEDWLSRCGISQNRIEAWKRNKEVEEKKQKYGTSDERLIYYSEFYDLQTLVEKNWELFGEVFGKKKEFSLFMKFLNDYRNPDAHKRELLPHQKHLVIGMSGEIRNRITIYRSNQDTGDSYFPRIENVRDNLGNSWVPGNLKVVITKNVLRPGDKLEFVVSANDPMEEPIMYCLLGKNEWQDENNLSYVITTDDIGRSFKINVGILSAREYHARGSWDDMCSFRYTVLPQQPR